MTDYLEELLSLQEQEEDRELLEWRKPVFARTAQGRRNEKQQLTDGEERIRREESERLEERSRREQRGSDDGQKHSAAQEDSELSTRKPEMESELTAQMTQLYRAVRWASAQASRGLIPGTGSSPASSNVLWTAGMSAAKEADYVALVDRAFARDARRYDGPLGLL